MFRRWNRLSELNEFRGRPLLGSDRTTPRNTNTIEGKINRDVICPYTYTVGPQGIGVDLYNYIMYINNREGRKMLIMICDKCDKVVNYIKSESYRKFYCDGNKHCTCQELKK